MKYLNNKKIYIIYFLLPFLAFPFFIERTFEISILNSKTEDYNSFYFNNISIFSKSYKIFISGNKSENIQKRKIPILLSQHIKFHFSEKVGNDTILQIHSIEDSIFGKKFANNYDSYKIKKYSNITLSTSLNDIYHINIKDLDPSINLVYENLWKDIFFYFYSLHFLFFFMFSIPFNLLLIFLHYYSLSVILPKWKSESLESNSPISILLSQKIKVVTFLCILLIIIFTLFKIHNSSIRMWDEKIGEKELNHSFQLFEPKPIRSDEYFVLTPFILSQSYNHFNKENLNLAHGNATIATVYNIPSNFILSPLLPFNYGFLLSNDIERAYSFRLNLITFGLFLSTFILLFILTKGSTMLSFIGGLWLLYSSPAQWWFYVYPMQIICINSIFISIITLLHTKKFLYTFISCIIILIFSFQFVYILYPPTQITLGYLLLFLFGFYYLENINDTELFYFTKSKILIILFFIILFFSSLFIYILDIKDVISSILNTEYPGKRIVQSGNSILANFISGFFDRNLLYQLPNFYPNQCEASKYLPMGIFLFPLVPFFIAKKKWMISGLLAFGLLFTIREFIGFPTFIENISLLNLTHRTDLSSGIVGIYSSILIFSDTSLNNYFRSKTKYFILYGIIVSLTYLFFSFYLYNLDPNYFSETKLLITFCFLIVLMYSFYTLKPFFLIIALLYFLGNNFLINPLTVGLDPLHSPTYKSSVLKKIKGNQNDLFLFMGKNYFYSFFLSARGFSIFSGVKYYPNFDQMNILDKSNQYRNIYNRYAHIEVRESNDLEPRFELESGDKYKIIVSPCSASLKQLDVKYIVFNYKEELEKSPVSTCRKGIQPIYSDPNNFLEFYHIDQFKEDK